MIKEWKSRVCFKVDSCKKRHHTILCIPSNNSSDGLCSYQNYHHTPSNYNTGTSEQPNETEATADTKNGKSHTF